MNFELLKTGFKAYLEEKGKIDKDTEVLADSSISIFMFASDFKEYMEEKLSIDSSEIHGKSISDIMKMGFTSNGKLIKKDEIEAYENALNGNNKDSAENIEIENDLVTNVFNELLKDEKFLKEIDTDGSKKISDEELSKFLDKIKDFDKNGEDVSTDDLLAAAQKIKEGKFNKTEKKTPKLKKLKQKANKPAVSNSPTGRHTGGVQSGNYGGNYGSSYGGGYDNTGVEEKTLKNMTKDELNTELNNANIQLNEKQNTLSAILNDSNTDIKKLKDNVETAFENYEKLLKTLDKELAEKVKKAKEQVNKKKEEISKKELEISNKEQDVSNKQNKYQNSISARENLENLLSQLEAENNPPENDLSAQIKEVKAQLDEAKKTEEEAKKDLETAKEELEKLKKEKKELIEGKGGLNELIKKKEELDNEVVKKYPQVEEAQKECKKAESTYDTEKQKAADKAKSEITEAQKYVDEVNTAITDYENREIESQYGSVAVTPELAEKLDAKLGAGFSKKLSKICKNLNCNPEDLLKVMCSESGLDPSAVNGSSGATGLIQFMPSTANSLGTTTSALRQMSAIEQLDYVEKYMMNWKGNSNEKLDAGTLYTMVFLPAYSDYDTNQTMCSQGSDFYDYNSGLDSNSDGRITKNDLAIRLNQNINLNNFF